MLWRKNYTAFLFGWLTVPENETSCDSFNRSWFNQNYSFYLQHWLLFLLSHSSQLYTLRSRLYDRFVGLVLILWLTPCCLWWEKRIQEFTTPLAWQPTLASQKLAEEKSEKCVEQRKMSTTFVTFARQWKEKCHWHLHRHIEIMRSSVVDKRHMFKIMFKITQFSDWWSGSVLSQCAVISVGSHQGINHWKNRTSARMHILNRYFTTKLIVLGELLGLTQSTTLILENSYDSFKS